MLFLIFTISYLVTSLINPGIPERNYYSQNFLKNNPDLPSETVVKCSRCNIIVPKYLNMTHCTNCFLYIFNFFIMLYVYEFHNFDYLFNKLARNGI